MKNYTVEVKVNKNFYNEPDYNIWDSDASLKWMQILRKKPFQWLLIIIRIQ